MLPFPAGAIIGKRFEVVHGPNETPSLIGGFSLVYICLDKGRSDFPVALKTLRPEFVGYAPRKMLLQECAVWVQIGKHEHIVQCFNLFTADSGQMFLVLELIAPPPDHRGVSLRTWMSTGTPLPSDLALRFTLHIARGMRHVVIAIPELLHRDLKPENVLIGQDMQARVTDFGLARVLSQLPARDLGVEKMKEGLRLTTNFGHGVAGTPLYMAPEAWTGAALDQRTDIYSLGCILKEMVTGALPIKGETIGELRLAHLSGQAQEAPTVGIDALRLLIRRLAAVNPNERPGSWQDAVTEIEFMFRQIFQFDPPTEPKLEAARADLTRECGAILAIAAAYRNLGKMDTARLHIEGALRRAEEGGDKTLAVDSRFALAEILDQTGSTEEAINLMRQCLAWYRSQNDHRGVLNVLGESSRLCRKLGNNTQALEFSDQILKIYQALGDRREEAVELQIRGNTFSLMERYSDALQAFKESMKIADEIKNEEFVAVNIFRTGTILCALGMWIEGRVSLRYALLLYNRVGHRDYAADVLKVIETFKGAGSFPSTRTALGLDRLFELGFTAEGVRRAVEEYPELLAPDILREFQQLSIEELGLSVLLEHLGAIGRALEICANDPSLSSKARRVLALQEERVNEAKVWFSRAVEFDAGRVAPPDHKAALQAFQKAADLGHAKAMYNLGVFCAEGRGVEKNYSEAMQWWMKAAALGDFEAAYNLGCHYYNGEGGERSPGDAFRWFIFAAERGSHDAQTYCGACYENGLGCDQDLQKAMRWYMKAAEQGDWRAECNIGTLYANGKGVNRNRVDACYWFYRSLIHLDEKRHAQEADKLRRYIACYVRFMSEEESHQMTLKTAALASELGPQGQERLTAIMQNFRDWITRQNFEDLVTEQDFEDWVTGKKQ